MELVDQLHKPLCFAGPNMGASAGQDEIEDGADFQEAECDIVSLVNHDIRILSALWLIVGFNMVSVGLQVLSRGFGWDCRKS